MDLFVKLLSGDGCRKSRLHDAKGNFAGLRNCMLHVGPAFLSGLLRICFGHRPELPWIAYSSIEYLGKFLNKDSRVLEFGSGMSTIWYARHAGQVFSVESSESWYEKISAVLTRMRLNNVTYRLATTEAEYCSFMSQDAVGFDLVMVDGLYRSKCITHARNLLRPNGILYLDNSDDYPPPLNGDMRVAEGLARELAETAGGQVTEITDFAPTQFFVQQALMVQLPPE